METITSKPSILDWLTTHGLRGLPTDYSYRTENGFVSAHHRDGCVYESAASRPSYGASGEASLCGCVVSDAVGEYPVAEFFRIVRALVSVEQLLTAALDRCGYNVIGQFPQLTALAIRHHRYRGARHTPWPELLSASTLFVDCPAAETIRKRIIALWDAAEAAHPVDEQVLREEIIRYVVRQESARRAFTEFTVLGLPVSNALQEMIWGWLSAPLVTTLLEEFYSERGDVLRSLVVDPINGSGFTLALIDDLDAFVGMLMSDDASWACHVGSPNLDVFDTEQGPRPLIIWYGLRAVQGSVAFGDYPFVVSRWLAEDQGRNTRRFADKRLAGGRVVPICENPGLEPHQWETAIALWDDSFANDTSDPGLYRNQEAAILAASAL